MMNNTTDTTDTDDVEPADNHGLLHDICIAVSLIGTVAALSWGLWLIAGGFLLCLGMTIADMHQ